MSIGYTKIPACRIAPDWLLNPTNQKQQRQARIVLAQDAWFWVQGMLRGVKKPKVQTGYGYVDSHGSDPSEPAQKQAKKGTFTVCALGALFVSDVLRNNKYDGDIERDREDITERIGRAFTPAEMDNIEDHFEDAELTKKFSVEALNLLPKRERELIQKYRAKAGKDKDWRYMLLNQDTAKKELPKKTAEARVKLLQEVDRLRLLAILENIIHNGKFQPSKGLAPRWSGKVLDEP